jgi:hypothetical protein
MMLMYTDHSFDASQNQPWNYGDLVRDLDLKPIIETMAGGDDFIAQVVAKALVIGVDDVDTILYRQGVLEDTLRNIDTVRSVYAIITQAITEGRRRLFWIPNPNPESVVFDSVRTLEVYLDTLDKVREVFDASASQFKSSGFQNLIHSLDYQFDRNYLNSIRLMLSSLEFPSGVSVAVRLGDEAELTEFTLINPQRRRGLKGLLAFIERSRYTWDLPERDEAGAQEMGEMKNRGLERVAKVLRKAATDVLSLINALRTELAFYIGCANLWGALSTLGIPLGFPTPREPGVDTLGFSCLHEVSLALRMKAKPVCNDLGTVKKPLLIISGANRGGKTVYLRSIGQAQLMMQCGMFVAAETFESSISSGVYTHFKREEDKELGGGKLDEELSRLSSIIDHVKPNSMVLFNESFASTNAREGSELAKQTVTALLERKIRVLYVTHFYEFPLWFYENRPSLAVFLVAERKEDGTRTFKVREGVPLETSFAEDVYSKIFGDHTQDEERE